MINRLIMAIGRPIKQAKWFSRYANLLHYRPGYIELEMKNFDYIEVDGCKFKVSDQMDSVVRVRGNPWFDGVRPTDTVLDIGANIGAITIPLAMVARHVYAIEPIFVSDLRHNIHQNGLKNVTVWQTGLGKYGKGEWQKYSFAGHTAKADTGTLVEIRKAIGEPIDFLKCDCEGAEWDIRPVEMTGIRELRFEFHIRRGREKKDYQLLNEWYKWLADNHYSVAVEKGGDPGHIMPIAACVCVRASHK